MIQVIKSEQRHRVDAGWLDARWHFSFGDYYDEANMGWGPLRVFNDDIVKPGGGFPMHPHRDMEIITYVLDGELEHQDSMGNRQKLVPGEVQVMSAGKGVVHSEYNPSAERQLRLNQIWILPRSKGNRPRWEQRSWNPQDRAGRWLPVVSDGSVPGTLSVDQDVVISVATLKAGERLEQEVPAGRKGYLFVAKGGVTLSEVDLDQGDQARVSGAEHLEIVARGDAEVVYLDLAADTGM
jgi:redox-sensitive bicupin YhaK (pirin superfamily)